MSDKFFTPVGVPVVVDPPSVESGFVRIYGRGSDAYALFDDGTEKALTGGVIVVSGTRDVSFPEELVLRSGLSLTIPQRIDSLTYSDARRDAGADVTNWSSSVVSNTNFTDTQNMTDTSTSTASLLSAQQTALSGAVTTTGELVVSLPDFSLTPLPTVLSTQLQWGWTTTAAATLQHTGFSLNVVISYSVDDGATFVPLETITAPNSSGNNALTITATYDELQKIRFKASGTTNSGTATSLDAFQGFQFRYARCDLTLTQSL